MSVLIELLGTSGWQIRQDVFNALACYGERVKEPITKVLDTANEDLFYWGVRLLGKMGARSRKNLVDLLKTSNRDRKFLIMSALAECGDREALELLIKSLSKSSGLSPKRASDAILRVGARALDPLVNALTDVPADQLYWYARTMIKLGRKGVDLLGDFLIERGEDYLWESRPAFEQLGVETLRTLEILIESPKKEVRVFAYQVLVDLDSEEACPILVQGLQDSAWVCKKMCADALIRAGDSALAAMRSLSSSSDPDELFWLIYVFKRSSEGRRRISELLRRTDKEVVSEAARALRDSVPEEAILPLLHCLRSESWVVRKEASESLVNAGPIAVSRIVESLAIHDSELHFWIGKILKSYQRSIYPHLSTLLYHGEVPRHLVATAMGLIADPSFEPHLSEALSDSDSVVVLHACWALQKIHPDREVKAVWGLLGLLEIEDYPVLEECALNDSSKARDAALEGLGSAEPIQVRNSIFLCGKLEIHESVRQLQDIVEADSQFAVDACDAFLYLKDRTIVPFLRRMLEKECPRELHSRILSVLGVLSEEDVIPSILRILAKDPSESERGLYHRCVFQMGLDAIPPLIEALGNEDVALRKIAAQLLLEFGALAVVHLKKSQHSSDPNLKYWSTKILKSHFQDET
jgi:HEAT repeat protein